MSNAEGNDVLFAEEYKKIIEAIEENNFSPNVI